MSVQKEVTDWSVDIYVNGSFVKNVRLNVGATLPLSVDFPYSKGDTVEARIRFDNGEDSLNSHKYNLSLNAGGKEVIDDAVLGDMDEGETIGAPVNTLKSNVEFIVHSEGGTQAGCKAGHYLDDKVSDFTDATGYKNGDILWQADSWGYGENGCEETYDFNGYYVIMSGRGANPWGGKVLIYQIFKEAGQYVDHDGNDVTVEANEVHPVGWEVWLGGVYSQKDFDGFNYDKGREAESAASFYEEGDWPAKIDFNVWKPEAFKNWNHETDPWPEVSVPRIVFQWWEDGEEKPSPPKAGDSDSAIAVPSELPGESLCTLDVITHDGDQRATIVGVSEDEFFEGCQNVYSLYHGDPSIPPQLYKIRLKAESELPVDENSSEGLRGFPDSWQILINGIHQASTRGSDPEYLRFNDDDEITFFVRLAPGDIFEMTSENDAAGNGNVSRVIKSYLNGTPETLASEISVEANWLATNGKRAVAPFKPGWIPSVERWDTGERVDWWPNSPAQIPEMILREFVSSEIDTFVEVQIYSDDSVAGAVDVGVSVLINGKARIFGIPKDTGNLFSTRELPRAIIGCKAGDVLTLGAGFVSPESEAKQLSYKFFHHANASMEGSPQLDGAATLADIRDSTSSSPSFTVPSP